MRMVGFGDRKPKVAIVELLNVVKQASRLSYKLKTHFAIFMVGAMERGKEKGGRWRQRMSKNR